MSQSISTLCRRTCADVGATTEKACCPRLFWLEHAGEKVLLFHYYTQHSRTRSGGTERPDTSFVETLFGKRHRQTHSGADEAS